MATLRQRRAVKKIVENHGNISKSMREVGYPETTAKNPKNLTESKGFKEAAFDYMKELEEQKQMTIKRLKEEMPQAKFAELSSHLERTTKMIELLEGRPTERVEERPYKDKPTEELKRELEELESNIIQ